MTGPSSDPALDLLVVGAGPTGISLGAESIRAGIDRVLLVDRGPLTASLLGFPTYMTFFTTRERLEIGDLPFTSPDAKPDRKQALAYYRAVVRHYDIPVATHEEVVRIERRDDRFEVATRSADGELVRPARAVAIATGYFDNPRRLEVPGEDQSWVRCRYKDPYPHFDEHVVIVGGGNSAAEAALELWRSGARVTIVHRGPTLKQTIKYWLKPDIENRIAEGSIEALLGATVRSFDDHRVEIDRGDERLVLRADAAYVLIGYRPDSELLSRAGIELDPVGLVPTFDPESGETNVPGLYVAGAIRAGLDTNRIFIDNSRDHSVGIVRAVAARRAAGRGSDSASGARSLRDRQDDEQRDADEVDRRPAGTGR